MRQIFKGGLSFWLAASVLGVIFAIVSLVVLSLNTVSAAGAPLDCLSCHTRVLESHDKLGSGSQACWTCHDNLRIGMLRLLDGTQVPLVDAPRVCGQCHSQQYQFWEEEKHGIASFMTGGTKVAGDKKKSCIDCHNPHQPKIDLSRIINLYPRPVAKEGEPLDCLSCHIRVLKAHDKLGVGSEACRACHSDTQMGKLHLAGGGTLLPLAEYPRLCAQCHQQRYEDWTNGIHGMPSWLEGTVEVHGITTERVGCISCHDPHQPQITLLNITKPHPAPVPPSPAPPTQLLAILGISLAALATIALLIRRGGRI